MTTPSQENYAFMHLSLSDMERVLNSIRMIEGTTDEYLKDALFRDAVISYVKPFSRNRGEFNEILQLQQNLVPKELQDEHEEIKGIRDKLFAHNKLTWEELIFGPGTGFTVKGYEKVYLSRLIEPLKNLARKVHAAIMNEMSEIKKNGL